MNDQDFADSMVKRIAERLKQFDEGVNMAQAALDHIGVQATIDEVALRFQSESDLMMFLKHAVMIDGVTLFNYAVDHVETYPIRSQYNVKYWFLTTPRGYRLECMFIEPGGGFSPLHNAHTMQNSFETPVHYSFKCFDASQYEQATKVMERENDWVLAQNCHSTYGQFAYYLTDPETDYALEKAGYRWTNTYIKPRMNMRDGYPKSEVSEAAQEYLGSKA